MDVKKKIRAVMAQYIPGHLIMLTLDLAPTSSEPKCNYPQIPGSYMNVFNTLEVLNATFQK